MPKQAGKSKYRMSDGMVAILIAIALIADLFTAIPFVGDFVGPIYWILFSLYLYKIGCGFINSKRLATEAVSFIAELVPGVQELPTIVAATIVIAVMIRLEDKTGIRKLPMTDRDHQIFTLNKSGRRAPLTRTGTSNQPPQDPNQMRTGNTHPTSQTLNIDGVRAPSMSFAPQSSTGTSSGKGGASSNSTSTSTSSGSTGGGSSGSSK